MRNILFEMVLAQDACAHAVNGEVHIRCVVGEWAFSVSALHVFSPSTPSVCELPAGHGGVTLWVVTTAETTGQHDACRRGCVLTTPQRTSDLGCSIAAHRRSVVAGSRGLSTTHGMAHRWAVLEDGWALTAHCWSLAAVSCASTAVGRTLASVSRFFTLGGGRRIIPLTRKQFECGSLEGR